MSALHRGPRRRFTAARLGLCMILVAAATAGLTTPGRAAGILSAEAWQQTWDRLSTSIEDPR